MSLSKVIDAMLVPGRIFSVRGLAGMYGTPNPEEVLVSLGWIESHEDGWVWSGPIPKNEAERATLNELTISTMQEGVAPKKEIAKPTKHRKAENELLDTKLYVGMSESMYYRVAIEANKDSRGPGSWIRQLIQQEFDRLDAIQETP